MRILGYLITLAGIVILTACSAPEPIVVPTPNAYTESFSLLDASTASDLQEVSNFNADEHTGPVAQVGYVLDTNTVLAAYSEDGYVVGWNASSSEIMFENFLGFVTPKSLGFYDSGNLLIGATEHSFRPSRGDITSEYIKGIAIWNVETGETVRCVSHPCDGSMSDADASNGGDLGAIMDRTGRWVLSFANLGVSIMDLSGESATVIKLVNSPDSYLWYMGSVAFDSANNRYAIIFQEGRVGLSSLEGSLLSYSYRTLAEGTMGDFHEVIAAQFDLSGRWLAYIRDDQLSVWEVKKSTGKLHIEESLPDGVALAFDQTGNLLFVGTNEKIVIWNLGSKTIIAEYPALGITSLNVSEDNRLLVWGNEYGNVYLWSVLDPN